MSANTGATPRGASPDDIDDYLRRTLRQQLEDLISAQQRERRLAFEREKKALADAAEARGEDMRAVQAEMQKLEETLCRLEGEKAAGADKERLLQDKYGTAMRRLDRLLTEGSVFDLRQPAARPTPAAADEPEDEAQGENQDEDDDEDEQAPTAEGAHQRRSNRARRPTARFAQLETTNTDTEPGPSMSTTGKRRRDADDDRDGGEGGPPKRFQHEHATVSFEEVYCDGLPEYRHAILEYPHGSGDWFILRCEQCGLHFGRNALQGGAKHLNGARHGWLPRDRALAVKELGVRVLGCDKDKAKRNNEAFDQAIEAGYVPRKRSTDQPHRQRQEPIEEGDEEGRHVHHGRKGGKAFEGITDPTVGTLYRAWYRGKGSYAALMLPLGSFETVGVVGNIADMDRQGKAPKCYGRRGERILGWASGYEDGGPKIRERKFPMMYLEESAHLVFRDNLVMPPSLGWVMAKDLRPFDVSDPECQRTKGYEAAQMLLRRASMLLPGNTTAGGTGAQGECDRGGDSQATDVARGETPTLGQAREGGHDRANINIQQLNRESEDAIQGGIASGGPLRGISARADQDSEEDGSTKHEDDEYGSGGDEDDDEWGDNGEVTDGEDQDEQEHEHDESGRHCTDEQENDQATEGEEVRQNEELAAQSSDVTDQEHPGAATESGTHDKPGLDTVAQPPGTARENPSDLQFFMDFQPAAEDLLSESRRLRGGGLAGHRVPLQPARRGTTSCDIANPGPRVDDVEDRPIDSPDGLPSSGTPNAHEIAQRALFLNLASLR
ncbi:hypothetical protein B0T14DRAFT_559040 [Immersiella caudata]|uniref:Uncharacterized protein n=1 Tax=Immersiella caudata TaxID=314043 RepID=A0AA40CBA0_9PEZI|nr:hypothetical protein B0T14DRAFT_559040 [Immersiella caudata]